MSLEIRALISAHAGEASALYEALVNPRLAKALRPIGFGRAYVRCSSPYLWDGAGPAQMQTPILCGLLAQEPAMKFPRRATGRSRILHASSAFHGLTTGALSVNGGDVFRDGYSGGSSPKWKATA
jgi:ornithine--oxo-acid transaminase